MKRKNDLDEHLEQLWYMKENSLETIHDLKRIMDSNFNKDTYNDLLEKKLIRINSDKIALSEKGGLLAQKIIRAHRIAERLISDVLQADFESGACEFEHTLNPSLVNSICTLLGHPRECPHGKQIPEGSCCKRLDKTATMTVISLTELKVGKTAQIASVQSHNDQLIHKLENLQIRPNTFIKLHQKYPTYVIECEGANIAIGDEIAQNIRVWTKIEN